MPVDMRRYGSGWESVSLAIRFDRAKGRCEWPGCHAEQYKPHPLTGSLVVLSVAHLPIDANGVPVDKHDKTDHNPYRLLALCQRHHLKLDHADHIQHGRETRHRRRAVGPLPGLEE